MAISLSSIDTAVQLRLRNIVASPLSQSTRVEAYNRVIDYLQSKSNWNFTRRVQPIALLNREVDYAVEDDLGVTDLKQIEDIRYVAEAVSGKPFEEIDSDELATMEREQNYNNVYSMEERDNKQILRVLTDVLTGDVTVDEMDDLTTGRTWASDTSTSDATTLVQDTTKARFGNSLRFNIDVSQSSNNRAAIYTSTSLSTVIDASEVENIATFRFDVGLHSITAANLAQFTGVTFVWGSDTSATPATKANYWSLQVTEPLLGDFKAGWNRLSYFWGDATKTGSPDAAALSYFEIQPDYSASLTDTNNVRVDQIKLFDPTDAELVYFSTHFVSKSGVLQAGFTTGTIDATEQLLLPQRHFGLFVSLALMELFPQKEKNNNDYLRAQTQAKEQLALAITHDGNAITREKNIFQVDGNSSGRSDRYYSSQW